MAALKPPLVLVEPTPDSIPQRILQGVVETFAPHRAGLADCLRPGFAEISLGRLLFLCAKKELHVKPAARGFVWPAHHAPYMAVCSNDLITEGSISAEVRITRARSPHLTPFPPPLRGP